MQDRNKITKAITDELYDDLDDISEELMEEFPHFEVASKKIDELVRKLKHLKSNLNNNNEI